MSYRGLSTRSERPQNRLMDTSRVDGVKAPLHNGTPRSRELLLVLHTVGAVDGGHPLDDREDQRVALAVVYPQILLYFFARLALRFYFAADGAHGWCVGSLPRQPTRRAAVDRGGRGSHGCAGPRARALGARMRLANATKLPVCWQAAALPSPHLTANQRRAVCHRSRGLGGPPERSGMNYRWQASRRHLVVLALDRRQCPCSPRKRRGRRGDRRPSLRTQTLRRLGAARLVFGGCPITGAQSSRHAPCAAATVRRRRAQLT